MKVIIIKDCKDGSVNDVIDVSDGYGKNFLINKGFAIAINNASKHKLESKIHEKELDRESKRKNTLIVKNTIDNMHLSFTLKATGDVIHGSVTRKQIIKKLKDKKIYINPVNIENKKIHALGISYISVKLFDGINAKLKVEVEKDG
ncbi:50S ribosomal protein L9 [Candidatus Mycoplasma mahonii]|uniref:50S ribosomal protein L9 n=1 Tax=Candidatus Mycoplasma mahonii TaxID=3004105 RepID=UPI0026F249B7|nr:50S ribosomal protein L9 [Candidatus Mycoplasma mahonii]WKX02708.1 50S ribosomal protein L9 [Candidatus Mycoplasma mahonii]